MQERTALALALAVPSPLSPAKRLALSTWADDGGAVVPGSGGEVNFYASQSPDWSREAAARQRRDLARKSGRRGQRA